MCGDAHQRHHRRASATASSREPSRNRIRPQRSVASSDQIGVETRHRGQPSGDGPSGQSRLTVAHPDHPAIAALMGQELEHIGRNHLDRLLVDHREERLEIEGDRPQAVGSGRPATNSR